MDLNKLSTIIENNTESEFLAKKDQQSQSILQRSCQKWITDDRSDQIKQGLHGDSDLKVISSFEDVIQNGNSKTNQKAQNDSNNINELEKSQFYQFNNTCSKQNNSSFFNINENEENPSNHYQKNKVEDQKQSKLNNQNELKVNEPATSRDKQNSKYDENQKQNNRRTTQIVQINNRLRDKTCSLYLNQNQFNQQKLKKTNELFKMVNVKLKVLEFIKKMKLKYINRKLEKISKFQIEIISDKCHFFESDSSQANSCIFNLFKGIKSLIKHIPILIPTNKIIILFDLLSIIYFYLFFFFFSIIAFFNQAELNSNQFAFCCLFSVSIMLLDLFESLNMAIFRRDMIILEREVIIKSYLLSFHFLTDFISLIALLTLIVSNPNQITFNPENQIWKYIQIIIVFVKIFGVKQKIKRTKNVITLSQNQKHIYKLFSQIFSVLQIAHISCIGWYSLTFIQQNERNWLQKINIQNSAYHIKNLAGINIRIQSQLKMDQEYQSFFNSEYDQSQQFISNIQVDDSKLHGCINENSQLYFNQLNEFNNTVNNCDQITFSKKQIQIDQSYMNSSKNQAQNIASKVLVDLNQKNNTINEGNQPEKEQDILAGFVQDDISYSNLNSLGDICNKNDAITSNTKISIHKRKKKSTIMKNYNYIDNVQVDKFQSCSTNQFEQESINLSANLITDSHYTQDQKYHKYLPSFATIQLYPEDKKNKNICSKVQENKILKACKEDIQSDLKSEQSQQSMMTISSNGKREKTTSLGRKSQIQKGFKTHDGDQQYVTHGNRQSILTVQRFFQYDFDQFKNYKDYFPQNNYNLVIKEYNMIQNINFKLLFSGTQTAKLQSDNDKIKLKLSPKSRYLLLKKLQKNSICYGISTKSCSKNQQVYDKNI
ncbi:hypothetical protein ABPG74_016180 [Tetrahymena malaccensis]